MVPNSTPTMLAQRSALHQRPKILLERIAARPGQPDGLANGDAAMLACELDDLQLQFGHGRQYNLLALDLLLESPHLLRQGAQKKREPWLPVRCPSADRSLGLPERQVSSTHL